MLSTLLLLVGAVALLLVAGYLLWHRYHLIASRVGGFLLIAAAASMLGNLLQINSADLAAAAFWQKAQYIGIVLVPPLWLAYVLLYTNPNWRLNLGSLLLLGLMPVVTLVLVFTNHQHHLMWQGTLVIVEGKAVLQERAWGLWFWVFVIYSYAQVLYAHYILVRALMRSRQIFRWQGGALLLAGLAIVLASLLDVLNVSPRYNFTTLAMVILGPPIVWSLYWLRASEMIPVARAMAFVEMNDCVIVLDRWGRIVDLNPAAQSLLKHDRREVLGQSLARFWPQFPAEIIDVGTEDKAGCEWAMDTGQGQRVYDVLSSPLVDSHGREYGRVLDMRDVTGRKQAEEQHKLDEMRLNSLLELSQKADQLREHDIIQDAMEEAVRLTGSGIGYLHFVNPDQRTIELKTWSESTMAHCTAGYESHYPLDQAGVWADCVRLGEAVIHNDYQNLPDKKGYPTGHAHLIRHASVPIYDEGRIALILGVGNKPAAYNAADVRQMTLIGNTLVRILQRKRAQNKLQDANAQLQVQLTEIEQLQEQLREQAIRDALTGLFNRRYLEETLHRELARARREGSSLSVVMMDVDLLKDINDTYGHQAGDDVLRELGALLSANVRASDMACRYGGDEFVVVMPGAPAETALRRAEAWRASFRQQRFSFRAGSFSTSLSIGVASFPFNALSYEKLIKAADDALYISKTTRDRATLSEQKLTG